MRINQNFDVIIIGGSYSGLSAAMSLGRALRKVLIIDGGQPCNRQTPHSHNFLTRDGSTPQEIARIAKEQVLQYNTVQFLEDMALKAAQTTEGFEVTTLSGQAFSSRKLILANGVKDLMPEIEGFAECWGISILHCPYCHGYEVRGERTGILMNGQMAFEMVKMISHWTPNLVLFTNGPSTLNDEQTDKIREKGIAIIETAVKHIEHINGKIQRLVLADNSEEELKAIYAKPAFTQHSDIPEQLNCTLTEHGLIEIDQFYKTSAKGVLACGDNSSFGRAVSLTVAAGTMAGIVANRELIEEDF